MDIAKSSVRPKGIFVPYLRSSESSPCFFPSSKCVYCVLNPGIWKLQTGVLLPSCSHGSWLILSCHITVLAKNVFVFLVGQHHFQSWSGSCPPFMTNTVTPWVKKNRVLKPIIPPCLPVLDLFFARSLKTVAFPNVTWQENNPNVWRSNPNILYVFHGCCVGFPRWTRRRYPGVAWCREDSSCPSAASPVVKSAARSSPKNLKVPVKHTQNIPKPIGFEPE